MERIERDNKDEESLCTVFKQFNLLSITEHPPPPSHKEKIQNSLLNTLEYWEKQLKEFVRVDWK